MSLEMVAVLAQVVGTIAVVLSLLYVAAELRHGTRVAKVGVQESAANNIRDFTKQITQSAEVSSILNRGMAGWDRLSQDELARFIHLALQLFKAMESIHYMYTQGLLDKPTLDGWTAGFSHYVATPGFQKYWALRKEVFHPAFQLYVDCLELPDAPITTLNLMAKAEHASSGDMPAD